MLTDLLADNLPASVKPRRSHFHAFMLDLHRQLRDERNRRAEKNASSSLGSVSSWFGGGTATTPSARARAMGAKRRAASGGASASSSGDVGGDDDLLMVLGRRLAEESHVLILDELMVTEVGDAMLLRRLLESAFNHGLVLVATSNRAPTELYKNGLQRELFVPCIHRIEQECDVMHLKSPRDYRLLGTRAADAWIPGKIDPTTGPAGHMSAPDVRWDNLWASVLDGAEEGPLNVQLPGRFVHVRRAAPTARAARIDFDDMCRRPLGAMDYLAIAAEFEVILLEGVPAMTMAEADEMRRLITLIDSLYDRRCKVFVRAAAEPDALFVATEEDKQRDVAFAWGRCQSRLREMGTVEYLAGDWAGQRGQDR